MQQSLTRGSQSALSASQGCPRRVARLMQQAAPSLTRAGRRNTQVVFAVGGRAKSGRNMMKQDNGIIGQNIDWTKQAAPETDDKNVQFVVFVRNLKFVAVPGTAAVPSYWVPLGPISGGSTANLIVQGMASDWGRLLFGQLMVRNIALGIYMDKSRAQTESRLRTQYGVFKGAAGKDLQYGFNIRDSTKPNDWYKPVDLTILPAETDLGATPQDTIKAFFAPEAVKAMFGMQ